MQVVINLSLRQIMWLHASDYQFFRSASHACTASWRLILTSVLKVCLTKLIHNRHNGKMWFNCHEKTALTLKLILNSVIQIWLLKYSLSAYLVNKSCMTGSWTTYTHMVINLHLHQVMHVYLVNNPCMASSWITNVQVVVNLSLQQVVHVCLVNKSCIAGSLST